MLRNILPPLTKTEIRAIEQATNYQELANARSEILSQALGKGQEQIKTTKQTNHQLINQQQKERIMWLIWLAISLSAIFSLALQLAKSKRAKKE